MKRLLPFPLLATAIFGMWVLLTGFSLGHILLGAVIAILLSRVMLPLAPARPRIRFGKALMKLTAIVFADIVRSNIAVARIVLFRPSERKSGFIRLPIELDNPYALATLAIIITATPGTLWLQHEAHNKIVLIHVLDLVDEAQWIELMKNRYETLLTEIFG